MKYAMLAAVAGLAVLPASADASWPGANGRVSLTQRVPAGEVRANRDIFAYPLGTDAVRARLTFTTDNEEQSSWSPDGRSIAFKRRDAVWVVGADGSNLRTLTTIDATGAVNNTQPSWSSEGRQIVFRSNRALAPRNVADVWIMNADGTNQRPVLVRPGDERYPSISPDGTKVLFRGDADEISGNGDEEIFVADLDGTNVRQLTHNAVEDSSPNWSPDGRRIALQVNVGQTNQEIYVMNADGSDPVRLTDNTLHDIGPSWSPDGRMIAFTRAASPEAPGDVWVMNADGSGQRPLTSTDVIEESPDWQPIPLSFRGTACGDVSLEPGGIASVIVSGVRCDKAIKVATRRRHGGNSAEFTCSETPHTFDQVLVECVKRQHCRAKRQFAYVYRKEAVVAKRLAAPQAALTETEELGPEDLGPDDELPSREED